MSKRMNFVVVVALAFIALLLQTGEAGATLHKTPVRATSTTAYYAFTGLVTKGQHKEMSLTGSLNLQIDPTGAFTGSYRAPNNKMMTVSGMGKSDGSLDLTMYQNNMIYLKGHGKANANRELVGAFNLFNKKKQVSSGYWSAILADPKNMAGLAFQGKIMSGEHKGSILDGALILDNQTLTGTLLDAAGNLIPCNAEVNKTARKIKITLGSTIIGTGKMDKNGQGYKGEFSGPAKSDMGDWEALIFGF